MRAFLICWLLLLLTNAAFAAERTWTIARDVFTADGELIAVRGESAYIKIDGKVEEVAIDRLSAIDQQYLATLSLAPISPEPAGDRSLLVTPGPTPSGAEAVQKPVMQEEMPLPGSPDPVAENELQLNAPALVPAYGGTPIREQSQAQRAQYRVDRYGRPIPPQPGVQAGFFTPDENPRANANPNANPNDRRYRRPPQQGANNQQRANRDDDDDDDDDDRPGLFRSRRQDRQRAAAARSR